MKKKQLGCCSGGTEAAPWWLWAGPSVPLPAACTKQYGGRDRGEGDSEEWRGAPLGLTKALASAPAEAAARATEAAARADALLCRGVRGGDGGGD